MYLVRQYENTAPGSSNCSHTTTNQFAYRIAREFLWHSLVGFGYSTDTTSTHSPAVIFGQASRLIFVMSTLSLDCLLLWCQPATLDIIACAFEGKRTCKSWKLKTRKKRPTLNTPGPRNPQQPGDHDHLEAVRDETRPTRYPILARIRRSRGVVEIGFVQPSQSVKTTKDTRTHTDTQTDRRTDAITT